MPSFPFYLQQDAINCGPACLKMVAKHYGKNISLNTIRNEAQLSKEGVNLLGISDAAEKIGFRTRGVKLTYEQLINEVAEPAILHWRQNHFVVLIPSALNKKGKAMKIAHPGSMLV